MSKISCPEEGRKRLIWKREPVMEKSLLVACSVREMENRTQLVTAEKGIPVKQDEVDCVDSGDGYRTGEVNFKGPECLLNVSSLIRKIACMTNADCVTGEQCSPALGYCVNATCKPLSMPHANVILKEGSAEVGATAEFICKRGYVDSKKRGKTVPIKCSEGHDGVHIL